MPEIPRMFPDLMVMGDSLGQGCRSFSVSSTFSSQCYGSIIAESQGWNFVTPDFPRPVLVDMEAELQRLDFVDAAFRIPGVLKRINRNLQQWQDGFTAGNALSELACFDNLAVAGTNLRELVEFTGKSCKDTILSTNGKDFLDLLGKNTPEEQKFGNLHLRINAGFVLNPSQENAWKNFAMLDWVRVRKPKFLIAHFGHNDGLYSIGGSGYVTNLLQTTLPLYLERVEELGALPKEVKRIVLILLPKISSVANLDVKGSGPNADGYWDSYTPRFTTTNTFLTGAAIQRLDEQIKSINVSIRNKVMELDPSGDRFRIVEAYEILKKYDYKNTLETSRQTKIGSTVIDNRYLEYNYKDRPPGNGRNLKTAVFGHGGFQSLDGMHPTAVGYALFAIEIMKVLNLDFDKDAILAKALRRETLVSGNNLPAQLEGVLGLMHSGRLAKGISADQIDPDHIKPEELGAVMDQTFNR